MTDTVAASSDLARVQDVIDVFLRDHDPTSMDKKSFRGAQYDAGLAWVHFPEGFGGLGLRPEFQKVIDAQLRKAGAKAADPASFFLALAGPTIVTHGTDEQKRRFLRPMFSGEHRWCQLFSEPGSGSDFAGLSTRAVRDGDEWIINGQKVWNTIAHMADYGMLVARSNPEAPKHKGLTYFALDMHSPGVEVRPLRQMTGEAEFNEVYMTDVRVPESDRIGAEGDGWRVSLTTLMNERAAIGGGSGAAPTTRGSGAIASLVKIWKGLPEPERSKAVLDQVMDLWVKAEALRLTNMRASEARRTGNPGPEGSVGKLFSAELNKKIFEKCIDLLGPSGLVDYDYTFRRPETLDVSGTERGVRHAFLRARANSIEGGTSEIMRNILGEQVLGLPGDIRVDKDLPWVKVPRN